jgi:hypothetical protein
MRHTVTLSITLLVSTPLFATPVNIEPKLHHLRAGNVREWSHFPAEAEGSALTVKFAAKVNSAEQTLRLRQQDVKQTWKVRLNGKELGRLVQDENDTEIVLPVPAGRLTDGENTLVIEAAGRLPDDIRVGEIILDDRPVKDVLNEATVEIAVREGQTPTPCRITILNARGALATVGASSTDRLAVRPGVIYSADGIAKFGLPAGEYTIHAGRGFEYGIDTVCVSLKPGTRIRKELTIRREVNTKGWIACDTHIHTLTHSGHGDSTDIERALTVAGEGIELPIATDHNKQIDYHRAAVKAGVRKYFTPVVGNEVTTDFGHFNVFPLPAGGPVPNFKLKNWKDLAASLGPAKSPRAVILNHPRDLHAKFRPFGPERHIGLTGEDLDGWELPANAMEVVNSGAQQSDVMLPVRDWFGMLNGGHVLTPVGASDSHDVSRYIVGQGRTYIRCQDDDPGEIDVKDAVKNFCEGRVSVSCGLFVEIAVNDKFGPGDIVPVKDDVFVEVRVLGPSWVKVDRVELYANGLKVHAATIQDVGKGGVKWSQTWKLPQPRHDVHLVAVASGPGVDELFWPIGKSYQPTSPVVKKRVIGVTGAVWLDADGDGKHTSAHTYAKRIISDANGNWKKAIAALSEYDEAVAAQTVGLLRTVGVSPSDKNVRAAAKAAGGPVLRGFNAYLESWRESQIARDAARP